MKENSMFQTEEVDLKTILVKYLRYWYLFIAGVLICLSIGFVYLRYSTPLYSIGSSLLVKDYRQSPDLFGNAAFHDLDLFNTFKNINNEIYILKSPDLMVKVLKELELQTSYYVEGNVKTSELYGNTLPVKIVINTLDSAAFRKTIKLHIKGENRFELEEENGEERSVHFFGQEIKKPYGSFTVLAAIWFLSSIASLL